MWKSENVDEVDERGERLLWREGDVERDGLRRGLGLLAYCLPSRGDDESYLAEGLFLWACERPAAF